MSLFGSAFPAASSAPPTGLATSWNFGAQQPQQSTNPLGAFGSTATNPTPFGAPAATNQAPTMFGAPTASTANQAPTIFGAPLAASTNPTPGFFGAPAGATATNPAPTTFGMPATATSTAAAAPNFGLGQLGFGQQQQPQLPQYGQLQFQQPQQAPPAQPPSLGLGGARIDVGLSGTQIVGGSQSVKTPKETEVPPEIMAIVEVLKQKIKENRDLSEEISSIDSRMFDKLASSYRSACAEFSKASYAVQKTLQAAKVLRAESRQDLLDGESAQRLKDNMALNFDFGAPLNYLLRLVTDYERQVASHADELRSLEKLIFGQQKSVSSDDISTHLKRVDSAFRYVTGQVNELDKKVEELKDSFKAYRRAAFGDQARYFPSGTPTSKSVTAAKSRIDRIEGPNPFSASSTNALLVIASALSRAQAGTGLVPNIGLPMQQQQMSSLFGTLANQQPSLGFGLQTQPSMQQPFATGQSLFRPFGSIPATSTAAPAAAITPFASGALSFNTGLGATSTTTAALPAATTASPWRFTSSPFNTSSSGTLFGGTASNVGAVKPLGLATPLQQVATPASLQLLNPPLGSERGKS